MELVNRLVVCKQPSKKWRDLHLGRAFEVSPLPLRLGGDVFCMGSCFARNIRLALEANGINCQPCYKELQALGIKKGGPARIDDLHFNVFHLNHYTPLSILQELRRSLHSAYPQLETCLPKGLPCRSEFFIQSALRDGDKVKPIYHDPARRLVYAETSDHLKEISDVISLAVATGMLKAKVFVITLGLIEQFFKDLTHGRRLWFNQHLTYGGMRPLRSEQSAAESLYLNVEFVKDALNEIIQTIRSISSAPVLFTVSPVPLDRTVRKGMNIIEANWLSKATLLVATREFVEANSDNNIYYFPSYEIVASYGVSAFQSRDSRHVEDSMVDEITAAFLSCTQR